MIRNLKEMGMSHRDTAKELGVSKNTVSRILKKTRIRRERREDQSLILTGKRSMRSSMKTISQVSGYLRRP